MALADAQLYKKKDDSSIIDPSIPSLLPKPPSSQTTGRGQTTQPYIILCVRYMALVGLLLSLQVAFATICVPGADLDP